MASYNSSSQLQNQIAKTAIEATLIKIEKLSEEFRQCKARDHQIQAEYQGDTGSSDDSPMADDIQS